MASTALYPAKVFENVNEPKRLTMVERARLEALASFGNERFETLSVKKTDFQSKLKSTLSSDGKISQARPITRMQRARMEVNSVFKNIDLGKTTKNMKKRTLQNIDENQGCKRPKTLTRLEKAKLDTEKAFKHVSLATLPKKKSKLEKEKLASKCIERKNQTENQKNIGSQQPTKSILKVSNVFNNAEVSVKPNVKHVNARRLTRSQSSKLEASKIFEEKELSTLNDCNGKVVYKPTHDVKATQCDEVAMDTCEGHNSTQPQQDEQHDASVDFDLMPNPKRLTRLEKAKLESLECFSGQKLHEICKHSTRIFSKYLKPKKVTNTEKKVECCSTPTERHTPYSKQHAKPSCNCQFYSSITEGSFKDQSSLLEVNRKVVETAVQLETPEGSPAIM